MDSLSSTVARHRVLYPRPILAMPDILMIDLPAEFHSASLPLGNYHPILIETVAEHRELEAWLDEKREVPSSPDLLDSRPSALLADYITVAHYGPPFEGWPYVLLCHWPPDLAAAAPKELRIFTRGAYTTDLYRDRDRLERESDRLLLLLRRRLTARVEIILPDWSAPPGSTHH